MSRAAHDRVVTDEFLHRLAAVADVVPGVLEEFDSVPARRTLAEIDVLVTGWGCPALSAAAVAGAPRLRAVVHTAGTVRHHVTPAVWGRDIAVSSAAAANAVPVAEYTLATVLLAGKQVLASAENYRRASSRDTFTDAAAGAVVLDEATGNFGRTVGILSASLVGRRVVELLRPHDLRVLVHDPYVPDAAIRALGAEPVGLPELFERSDVLSVHTPLLPETRGLVSADLLARLPDGATLINTARGAVVDNEALVVELRAGRLHAVLDVTDPEPLPAGHALWDCPNVLLTPHVAGSLGNELRRLTACAAGEVERFAAGLPFAHPVLRAALERSA
ncbi:hydroxyacid dehydrogenase [Kineococcus sp. LSe6-4]|uniref:Hydroxyacid dehydrogenase n=1 Tax=Kineococcus halophytocola TaxID=3234027 RepID=A0ABV4H5L6_9ACTN